MISTDAKTNLYLSHERLSIGAGCSGRSARKYKNDCAQALTDPPHLVPRGAAALPLPTLRVVSGNGGLVGAQYAIIRLDRTSHAVRPYRRCLESLHYRATSVSAISSDVVYWPAATHATRHTAGVYGCGLHRRYLHPLRFDAHSPVLQ